MTTNQTLTPSEGFRQSLLELEDAKRKKALLFDRDHYWFWFEMTAKFAAEVIAETM